MPVVLDSQIQMLRARIENSLAAPYALLVSSATDNDGKSVCAQGLAESLAATGQKTLLVDLDHDHPRLTGLPPVKSLAIGDAAEIDRALVLDGSTGIYVLSLANTKLAATASKESVSALLKHLRSQFDAIVIESGRILDSSIGTSFSSECDAVILTALEGRSVRSEDKATVESLDRENAKFFGVVIVGARTIAEFRQRTTKLPLRASTSNLSAVAKTDAPMSTRLVL